MVKGNIKTIFGTFLKPSSGDIKLKHSLNSFSPEPETNRVLNRLATFIS